MLKDYCVALGWQGGTHTQVVREIERLKQLEASVTLVMSDLAFQAGNGRLRIHPNTVPKMEKVAKLLGKI